MNGADRRLVQKAYDGVADARSQKLYDEAIQYKPATEKQVIAAKEKGVQFNRECSAGQSISDAKGADQLLTLKNRPQAVIKDGVYCDAGTGNIYTVQNGKVVSYQVRGQQPVTDIKKIMKNTGKRQIEENIANGNIKIATQKQIDYARCVTTKAEEQALSNDVAALAENNGWILTPARKRA